MIEDENQVAEQQDIESTEEKKTRINYKELYEKTQSDLQAVLRKKEELLNEKKSEADKRRQAEQMAEQERIEKARKEGDYESIIKSAEAQRKEFEEKYNSLKESLTKKEVRQKALQLANELKPLDGDAAETLADYIEKRIKLNDNSLVFLDKDGQLSVMDAESLKNEFRNSNKFKPLLRGSEATGGGAPGANSSAKQQQKELTMEQYNNLSPTDKLEFSKLVQAGKAVLTSQ